jgi:hypothetical protein
VRAGKLSPPPLPPSLLNAFTAAPALQEQRLIYNKQKHLVV